VIKLTHLKY